MLLEFFMLKSNWSIIITKYYHKKYPVQNMKKILYTKFQNMDEIIAKLMEKTEVKKAITRSNLCKFWAKVAGEKFANNSKPYSMMRGSDRKSTRLNSSHQIISYAVFCLKKNKTTIALIKQTINKKHRMGPSALRTSS